jgi:hypothetical protein
MDSAYPVDAACPRPQPCWRIMDRPPKMRQIACYPPVGIGWRWDVTVTTQREVTLSTESVSPI